jgi:hypothetical protein
VGVIIVYLILAAIILYFTQASTVDNTTPIFSYVLIAVTFFFLFRYLSTRYRLDPANLYAIRLIGSRKVEYATIRKIEYANLRDLGPIGMFANWGYRGRVWSPLIGHFDAIYTDSHGLLISSGEFPLFISPKDPDRFARELSRRVRSYSGPLEVDVGAAPLGSDTVPEF